MKKSGAEIVWEMLKRENVDVTFGIPGGAIMHMYHPRQEYGVHHVLMRHEQCAAHAADAYARISGKVGVAIATSGPGSNQSGHRYRDGSHGFLSHSLYHRASADISDRHGCIPGDAISLVSPCR